MARSKHENLLIDVWLKMYSRHQNPIWATEELEWTVLVKHYYDFEKLNEFEQWEIRNMLGAFSKLYK
jgi:hypothetical protein